MTLFEGSRSERGEGAGQTYRVLDMPTLQKTEFFAEGENYLLIGAP